MPTKIPKATLTKENVLTEDCDEARELHNKNVFGTLVNKRNISLSFVEGLYLLNKNKLKIFDSRNKEVSEESFVRRVQKREANFWTRYVVFKNLRDRGYVVKTALKFGGDFRVYDRGIKPGEDHAKWVVFPVHEASTLTWHEFSAKNRVAHSTKKRLLLGVVDAEDDVSYWESRWIRP
ncbi:MAG: tRNA-intron lyase [Nanoarchaeota archaeon]